MKFFIENLGCQMNVYDSDVLRAILKKFYQEAEQKAEAEVIIYLTCAVREHAEEHFLGMLQASKNGKINVVGGCVASLRKHELLSHNVHIVIGPDNYLKLPELIRKYQQDKKPIVYTEPSSKDYRDVIPDFKKGVLSTYITVMRGCNNFCSYCVVPFLRGRQRSKPIDKIVNEVREAKNKGVKEVFLIGQNVMGYQDEGKDFADLVLEIEKIEGIERIGFLTSHPRYVSQKILDRLKTSKKLLQFFHIPFQAGSNRILNLMNRGYTKEDYLRLIEKIKEMFEEPYLSTDVIVGFPTETDEDFNETLNIMRKVEFDFAYMFKYSERPLIKAASIEPKVEERIKSQRLKELIDLQNRITKKKAEALLTRKLKVFVMGEARKGGLLAKTRNNRVVVVKDATPSLLGKEIEVQIEEIKGWTPIGTRRCNWQ